MVFGKPGSYMQKKQYGSQSYTTYTNELKPPPPPSSDGRQLLLDMDGLLLVGSLRPAQTRAVRWGGRVGRRLSELGAAGQCAGPPGRRQGPQGYIRPATQHSSVEGTRGTSGSRAASEDAVHEGRHARAWCSGRDGRFPSSLKGPQALPAQPSLSFPNCTLTSRIPTGLPRGACTLLIASYRVWSSTRRFGGICQCLEVFGVTQLEGGSYRHPGQSSQGCC